MIGRIWTAAFAQGNLRLWAIILGAPPLCGILVWVVYLIRYGWPVTRAQQQLSALFYIALGLLALIAVIVTALATVKVRATIPGSTLEIDGDDD